MNAKTIKRGLIIAGSLFLGNLIGVPLIQKGKTVGDGFMIGCIVFFVVVVIFAIIAAAQGRDTESRSETTTRRE